MPRDYQREAAQEDGQRKLRHAWVQERIAAIHARVSTYDILRRFGVVLQHSGETRIEQFSCPFHGKDTKPSARVYPASATSPTHAWCYVCQERWDVITLWRKFNDPTVPFTRSLAEIERDYGLKTPEMPNLGDLREAIRNEEAEAVLDHLHTRVAKGTIPTASARATIQKILDKIGEKCRVASP